MNTNGPKPVCERCGAPALVHIRPDASDAQTVHHFCLTCADEQAAIPGGGGDAALHLSRAALLVVTGITILLVSVGADFLAFGRAEGFGWKQMAGVVTGGSLVLVGAIAQAPTILVVGVILGGITLLADWLHLGSEEGFGSQQVIGSLLGGVLILVGLLMARR